MSVANARTLSSQWIVADRLFEREFNARAPPRGFVIKVLVHERVLRLHHIVVSATLLAYHRESVMVVLAHMDLLG